MHNNSDAVVLVRLCASCLRTSFRVILTSFLWASGQRSPQSIARQTPSLWLTDGWPEKQWFDTTTIHREAEPLAVPVTANGLQEVIASLKDVATRCSDNDVDMDFSDRERLAAAVRQLESVATSLHNPDASSKERAKRLKVPAGQAVHAFLAVWMSRDKQRHLPVLLRQLLLACWPNTLGEALAKSVDDLSTRLPSSSSLQRWAFPCDMAIMLHQRQTLHTLLHENGGVDIVVGVLTVRHNMGQIGS